MESLLQKGDLVRGRKPWNKDTILGVVVEKNSEEQSPQVGNTFRVFWLNGSEGNVFTSKQTFSTWEVLDSLERIANGD
jgi:hypothetical protein